MTKAQRKPVSRQAMMYPRKRAVSACQACRLRKTKCNNERPTCGFCQRIGQPCTYDSPTRDLSSFDPASLAILDRLEQVLSGVSAISSKLNVELDLQLREERQLLAEGAEEVDGEKENDDLHNLLLSSSAQWAPDLNETDDGQNSNLARPMNSELPAMNAPPSHDNNLRKSSTASDYAMSTTASTSPHSTTGFLELESCSLTIPFGTLTPEKILLWPVFNDLPYVKSVQYYDFPLRESYGDEEEAILTESTSSSFNLEEIPSLMRSFLMNVHVKNTVCDAVTVQKYAAHVCQHGWDTRSCIILHICALGTLARPWAPEEEEYSAITRTIADRSRRAKAKLFFLAARKRMGLLSRYSLDLAICYYLSHQYFMYTLQVQEAYWAIHEACVICKTHLMTTSFNTRIAATRSTSSRRAAGTAETAAAEQRLFWTCLKSEIELLVVLPRPLSGISEVDYPVPFPAPPKSFILPDDGWTSLSENSDSFFQDIQEQGWFHYLTEIHLRRLANQMINAIYKSGYDMWLHASSPQELLTTIKAYDEEIQECHSNLAPIIKFEYEKPPKNELQLFLSSRFMEMYEYLLRPVVFYEIHHHSGDPEVRKYIDRYFYYCDLSCVKVPQTHRHYGLWFTCRGEYSFALVLLAAFKAGGILSMTTTELERTIGYFLASLRFWQNESPDLAESAELVEKILHDVLENVPR